MKKLAQSLEISKRRSLPPPGEASDDESVDEGEKTDEEPTTCEGSDGLSTLE